MTTKIECRPNSADVEELIAVLERTSSSREIELTADLLGAARDSRAIRPLLVRLGDWHVQEDADVEGAVCHALVALGVMCSSGNHCFCLRPRQALADDVVETIRELDVVIPWPYYGTRRI